MKIICFPHFFYLSEVSRLIEIGKVLRELEQDVIFFSHGGPYESFAREAGFEVVSITPIMSPERAKEYMTYNRGEGSKSLSSSFFTYEELKAYVPAHLVNPMADIAITHGGAGTVQTAIYSGTPLVGIPMHQEQAGNVSLVKRHGAGIMLWKQELTNKHLTAALETLVTDSRFRKNMKRLKMEQDQVDGAAKAAQEIVNFL